MAYKHLSVEEREHIEKRLWEGTSLRTIAEELKRSHSSVVRELQRHRTPTVGTYTPRIAHAKALRLRASRGRTQRLKNDRIRAYTISHLKKRWSPEQIAGRIRYDCGEQISHEAVYQFIYAQIHRNGWGCLRPGAEDLRPYLRHRKKRRTSHGTRKAQRVCRPRGISIDLRPEIVNRRSRIGDWEGDMVESKDHKPGINTLVERKTGILCMTRLPDKTSGATRKAIATRICNLPDCVKKTLTLDNGSENQDWEGIETDTGMQCFFAHPYHSWERGTNENTNGLIRDYFPKKTDFDTISDDEIRCVEWSLNTRPRKRLNWRTPLEVWSGALKD